MAKPSAPRASSELPLRAPQLREILTRLHLLGAAQVADRLIRRLHFSGIKSLRSLARTPLLGRWLDPLLARVDQHDRLHFEQEELLRVCAALRNHDVPFWLAGGWGLDALVGNQTRRHHDLDLVIHPFEENLPRVATLLASIGYQRTVPLGGTVWFPGAEVFVDNHGHDIQVLRVNWEILTTVQAMLGTGVAPLSNSNSISSALLDRCTATGNLNGLSVPVISRVAQQLFHLGYPSRREESHAMDVLRLATEGQSDWTAPTDQSNARQTELVGHEPSTLLLVPIFSFPPDLWRLCRLYHNDLLVPPHVTLAVPFQPLEAINSAVVRQLKEFFEQISPFDFELGNVRWFDTKVVYLEPTNAETFRSITEGLQQMFPDFQPYGGAFDAVIPHVTLSEHGSLADRRIIGRHAHRYTPIAARATHVWLMSNERHPDDWRIAQIFSLGDRNSETRD